jgi:hypothetical protein
MNIKLDNLRIALRQKGYKVFEDDSKPFNLNLVGIRTKDETSNSFNDWMVIFWKYAGNWSQMIFPITTDPGLYWRENPMNIKGTAVLKEGQYRGMWKIGKHQGKYEALRQVKPCTVLRDANKDGKIDFTGEEDTGLFGINHHRAGSHSTRVDKWSAGCQVQPNRVLYDIEMALFKAGAKEWGNSFTYTLIHERDL